MDYELVTKVALKLAYDWVKLIPIWAYFMATQSLAPSPTIQTVF
jgi:hypothetical protein